MAEYGGVAATDEGGVKYLLSDWQGSTRAVVGNGGFVKARMDYTAYMLKPERVKHATESVGGRTASEVGLGGGPENLRFSANRQAKPGVTPYSRAGFGSAEPSRYRSRF